MSVFMDIFLIVLQFKERNFDEDVSDVVYRQQNRVPKTVIDYLELKLADLLEHPTKRNKPLPPRHQVYFMISEKAQMPQLSYN